MKSYRDLEIYKMSYKLAIELHKMSLKLPQYEMYEEGSQLRRSSKGITANIVEGYGRKKYKAEFIKFLVYAQASCDETVVHLGFIRDTHAAVEEEIRHYIASYEELGSKINRFIQYVGKEWNKAREE